MSVDDSFGGTVRRLREARKIGLRKFAQRVGMSPTYLSKVERDEFNPPSEEKIKAIAKALGSVEIQDSQPSRFVIQATFRRRFR